eukprot:tig00020538_g10338.t1
MGTSVLLPIAGLLVFGTIISLTAKLIFEVESTGLSGQPKNFEKPWFLTMTMFASMCFCFPLLWLKQRQARRAAADPERQPLKGADRETPDRPETPKHKHHRRRVLLALVPALTDLLATLLMMSGLVYTTVSINQVQPPPAPPPRPRARALPSPPGPTLLLPPPPPPRAPFPIHPAPTLIPPPPPRPRLTPSPHPLSPPSSPRPPPCCPAPPPPLPHLPPPSPGSGLSEAAGRRAQTLNGANLVFCALFSVLFLGRRLDKYHCTGLVLCVIGITLVGIAGGLNAEGGDGVSTEEARADELFGIGLILVSQMVHAFQMVIEEYLLQHIEARLETSPAAPYLKLDPGPSSQRA